MQGTCWRRTLLYGRTACNKYETQVRRLLPVACLPPSRADPQDVSLVLRKTAGNIRTNTNSSSLRLWFRRSILASAQSMQQLHCAFSSIPAFTELLSTNGRCFDMLNEAIWLSPVLGLKQ